MKTRLLIAAGGAVLAVLLAACEPLPPGAEPGPHGTMAYYVSVDATPPGARIEANGQILGNTPLTLKIFGDRDGTFHDFGSYYYVVRALPLTTNQFVQTRLFGTGRYFSREDHIPKDIHFDMNQPEPNPPPMGPPGYPGYGPYPYPYYYGPAFQFYFGPGYYHGYHHH